MCAVAQRILSAGGYAVLGKGCVPPPVAYPPRLQNRIWHLMCYRTRPQPLSEFPPFCTAPQFWTAGSWIFPAVSR
jgi:hypothetical protein